MMTPTPTHKNLLTLLTAGLLSIASTPAPAAITMLTANPAPDCSTQINIGWHADLHETSCTLIYTQKNDTTWAHAKTIPGIYQPSDVFHGIYSKTPDNKDWHEDAKFLDYGVTLTGLQPDTEYMYKVTATPHTTATTTTATSSAINNFKTAGAPNFSFAWISDVHTYTPIPSRLNSLNAVFNEAIKIQPGIDFVFSTGDMIAWGGSYSFWKKLFQQPFITDYLFADTIGNHDWMIRGKGGSDEFFRISYNNPTNGYPGQEGVTYWFIYGDILFLTLNNEHMRTSDHALATAQTWAANVIQQQKGKYNRIILAQHYQWFDGRNGKSSWYPRWKDFCDQHNVTLALSGNNHVYLRTHTLRGDQVVPDGQGTVYMQAPSSDGERGVRAGDVTINADKIAYTYSSQAESGGGQVKTKGCVLVDVAPDSIRTRLVYIDENGAVQVADEHTVKTARADATHPAKQ